MTVDFVRIEARVAFLRTDEGGRISPIRGAGSFRPNHNFFGPDDRDMCIGSIELIAGEEVHPGDTVRKIVTFVSSPIVVSEVQEGRTWRIQEGPHLIAIGTVLRIIDSPSGV